MELSIMGIFLCLVSSSVSQMPREEQLFSVMTFCHDVSALSVVAVRYRRKALQLSQKQPLLPFKLLLRDF